MCNIIFKITSFVTSIASFIICSTDATNAIPYTTTFRQSAFFVPRGGGSADHDVIDSSSIVASDRQPLIGVIDLRPDPEPDSILFLQDDIISGDDENGVGIDTIVQQALFPAPAAVSQDDILSANEEEEEMDQQAASSHSIGSLCSTVYLIIAYDFENGKTVLHRSFGGSKLMAFVDGVRSRRHQQQKMSDAANQVDAKAASKLVLVLVPSSSLSAMNLPSSFLSSSTTSENMLLSNESKPHINKIVLDLTNNNAEWNASGAKFLVDRLSEAFSLGGEEYRSMESFIVEMVGAFDDIGQEVNEQGNSKTETDGSDDSDNEMNDVVLRHIECSLLKNDHSDTTGEESHKETSSAATSSEEFQDFIRHTYESAGGVGENVHFQ
mmetsp:Transcript_15223/g.27637  ORF Transcript_15223/g.27637 Transcript_15223/m.27637 type:complete len:381 (+) Transcript_15223:77-1219(+)